MSEQGELVGRRYRLIQKTGDHWRAVDENSDDQVLLSWERLPSSQDVADRLALFVQQHDERTRRQAAALRTCPNLAFVDDLVAAGDGVWSVTRHVEGRTLAEDIAHHGPAPAETLRPAARDLLRALSAAHAEGMTHGGIAPEVVRLEANGTAVLTGFDAIQDPDQAGEADDVRSLGAVLFYALEGRMPGESETPTGELGPLIAAMRAEDPDERISAGEALALLGEAENAAPHTENDLTSHRVLPVVGAILAIGILLLLVVGLSEQESTDYEESDSDSVSTTDSDEYSDEYSEESSDEYSEEISTTTSDSTAEAFEGVVEGSCLPIYQDGNEEWNTSTPPDPVPCNSKTAGVFKVISTSESSSECTIRSTDYVPWSYEDTTLCLDRVWIPDFCVLAETTSEGTDVGETTAVDCTAPEITGRYNTVLVVSSVRDDPSDNCAPGDTWVLKADEGESHICFRNQT